MTPCYAIKQPMGRRETLIKNVTSKTFPKYCLACGKYGNYLCKRCIHTFPQNLPECYLCRKVSNNSKTHKHCLNNTNSDINAATTLYQYTKAARKIMKKFKYEGVIKVEFLIEELVINKLVTIKTNRRIQLIPIPLHNKRLLRRGYNQAELIAKIIQRKKIGRIQNNILFKYLNTKTQVREDKNSRSKKQNPFKCLKNNQIKTDDLLLIIDDVMTTGTTTNQASEAIRKVYPNEIQVLTLFRPQYRGK
jgi:competence protein ComFC